MVSVLGLPGFRLLWSIYQ